jgi:UDP-2,4-diacetamido-2,4,6-trideoxy-beta-L-altropyranose hydrolase
MKNRRRVVFRADASTQLGLGHITRCIALGCMLKGDYNVMFYCREIPPKMREEICENGFQVIELVSDEEFMDEIRSQDIIVLDGYHFSSEFQRNIKKQKCLLVVIDDLHDKEHFADLIINPAPNVCSSVYQVQSNTKFALGPNYSLLRPIFLEKARIERKVMQLNTVMLCLGGSDIKNLTLGILRFLVDDSNFQKIHIVTGSSYNYLAELRPIILADSRVFHYHAVSDIKMMELMSEADLSVVSASGILFESLACGSKTIAGYYVDNQMGIYNGFLDLGSVLDGSNLSQNAIRNALLEAENFNPVKVIDGKSGERLLQVFKNMTDGYSSIN